MIFFLPMYKKYKYLSKFTMQIASQCFKKEILQKKLKYSVHFNKFITFCYHFWVKKNFKK